jgi:hypothetical protein
MRNSSELIAAASEYRVTPCGVFAVSFSVKKRAIGIARAAFAVSLQTDN